MKFLNLHYIVFTRVLSNQSKLDQNNVMYSKDFFKKNCFRNMNN